jgi:DNA primase
MINIRGHEIEVDIFGELNKYDWQRGKVRGEKFLACSPFRDENHPSFAVRLDTGVWIDSGTYDLEWKKGNFARLLSYLRNETYQEAEEYLICEYSRSLSNTEKLKLKYDLTPKETLPLSKDILNLYNFRHKYLNGRGVDERVQRAFTVGYDEKDRAITLPWFDRVGRLANIKFRSIRDKRFWYYPGGQPIRDHLFGLNMLYRVKAERVYIVEAEIDALTLWQNGIAAVAMGGANLTGKQRELILQAPIRELVIATDNDQPGQRIADSIVQQLNGYLPLKKIELPTGVKDVNDLPSGEFLGVVERTYDVSFNLTYSLIL